MTTGDKKKAVDAYEIEKKLAEYSGEDRVIASNEMYEHLKEVYARKRRVSLTSGIPSLDKQIVSFEGGELTVISGATGHGKTLLALSMSNHMADDEKHVLWFTYEVTAWNFLNSFGEDIPKFYMPMQLKSNSLDWIYQRIYEAKVKYGLEAVFIDHLHYLVDMNKHSISLEIGHVMRFLKKCALRFNIAIFLIAHTTKVRLESNKEIDIEDIRDSSFCGQEADNVLLILRDKKEANRSILKVAKNRRFGVMDKKIKLTKVGKFLCEEVKF